MPAEPPLARPRVHGNDAAWFARRVEPFLSLPCETHAKQNLGYFGEPGVWDAKGYWQKAALDYTSCGGGSAAPYDNIAANAAAARYLDATDSEDAPRFRDGRRCLFLLRLLWRCADLNDGSYASCLHSESETGRLARAVVDVDLEEISLTALSYLLRRPSTSLILLTY